MKNKQLPGDLRVYITLAVLLAVLVCILPRGGKFDYDYRKGAPWTYETLVAQFDFPVLKTPEQLAQEREAAGSRILPYYRYSEAAGEGSIASAESLPLEGDLKLRVVTSLSEIYNRGVLSDDAQGESVIFLQRDKRATRVPASEVFTVTTARERLLADARRDNPLLRVDSLFQAVGVYDIVVPNLLFDKETTALVHAESADYISPTQGFVGAGAVIVSEGELVTAEVCQMLDSYKTEYEASLGYDGPRFFLWAGNAIIALLLVLILFLSVLYTNPLVFDDFNRYLYLVFIFLLFTIAALLLGKINPDLLYIMPFSLAALYLMAFFKTRVVLPVYIVTLLPLLIFSRGGVELFVLYLTSGVVTILVFPYFSRGWRQFVAAIIAFSSLLVAYSGFRLLGGMDAVFDFHKVLYLFIGSLLSVAGYPLIYLFERVFMLVSNSRLQELCDTNNKLLRELAQKAPGTFQHSLQVMNMADAAARSIDANVLLVRAGALYHDIGKMNNPQCFIENEALDAHYHDALTPQESAREIVRHVPDGLALAERYKLPQVIKDFILTHHGTSATGYFLNKYLNEGGDPSRTSDFTYDGRKPWTKEQTILMLSDSLEAASRTLKDTSPEAFSAFVDRIVAGKKSEGQLDEADISLRDLNTLKAVFTSYLGQMYHERVVYPKRKR